MTVPKANIIQRGFRAALSSGEKNLTNAESVTNIVSGITGQLTDIAANPILNNATMVIAAIAAKETIDALDAGYKSLIAHQDASNTAYNLFIEDYKNGSVSFFLPTNASDRSGSHDFFEHILTLFQERGQGRESPLFRYAGIHYSDNATYTAHGLIRNKITKGTYYSLLSMASLPLAKKCEYARGEDPILDRARCGSAMFLRANLPIILEIIHNYSSFLEIDITTRHLKQDAIRRLDLVRFIVIAFSNILINIEHPSDLTAGADIPLNDKDAIALCEKVKEVLDILLVPATSATPSKDSKYAYFKKIYCNKDLVHYLQLLRREVQELQEGYQSKRLNQLNLNEVIAMSLASMQSINATWQKLLFLDAPHTKSEHLIYLVRRISNGLDLHRQFWRELSKVYQQLNIPWPANVLGLNANYTSVVDLIGIFSLLSSEQRDSLVKNIPSRFADITTALKEMDMYFMQPLASVLSQNKMVGKSYLMNLIALSVDSHPPLLQEPTEDNGNPSLQKQFASINLAQRTSAELIFTWDILDCLGLQKDTVQHIKARPTGIISLECQFMEALGIVRSFQDLLDNNKNLLLLPDVQRMLRKSLLTLGAAHKKLMDKIGVLTNHVNQADTDSPAERKQFIAHMLADERRLIHFSEGVSTQIEETISVLNMPRFAENLREEFVVELNAVYGSQAEFETEKARIIEQLSHLNASALSMNLFSESRLRTTTRSSEYPSQHELEQDRVHSESNDRRSSYVSLRLQVMLRWMRVISAFLLIAGVLILLSLTYGAAYLPIIAALSSQQMAIGTLAGCMSSVGGGLGLTLSFFYKPAAPNLPSSVANETAAAPR